MKCKRPIVLSIAGHDPSAGAGLLADIKTFENIGVYGFGVNTSITFQNDIDFVDLEWLSTDDIIKQIFVLTKRFKIDFVKFGIIKNLETLNEIIDFLLFQNKSVKIVWDPILKSSTGFDFHKKISNNILLDIMKKITLITPNLIEAKNLFMSKHLDNESFNNYIFNEKLCNILIKGGHSIDSNANDILFNGDDYFIFEGDKFNGISKHGSGCVLSAAIIAYMALGNDISKACLKAKTYTERFLLSNETYLGYHSTNE